MGKVITSKGLNEFIASGKTEDIKSDPKAKAGEEAPALEVKQDKPITDIGEKKVEAAEDIYSEEDQETKEEISKAKRFDALMRKKHRAMKEAQERAAEDERLAESQYNRARLAEQRLAETERKIAEYEQKVAPPKLELVVKKPDPKDARFHNDKGEFVYELFDAEQEKYLLQRFKQQQVEERRIEEEARAQEQARKAFDLASERIALAEKKYPDYRDTLAKADVHTWNQVLEYISTHKQIGDLSYYLSTHPEFVERINKLHPYEAIGEVRDIAKTFDAPAPKGDEPVAKVISQAPAPIVPLSSQASANTNTDPAKMNFRELRAYERQRKQR